MIRLLDVVFSTFGIILLSPLFMLFTILGYFDTKSPFFIQNRVGKDKKEFKLIKFRSMRKSAPSIASHLIGLSMVTSYGRFIRRFKIDELPQLINVLLGQMSLVGARPCLPNQDELLELREKAGIFNFRPGITGLAQIENVDMSNPVLLVNKELIMYESLNTFKYLQLILLTISGKGRGDASSINHK